MKHLCWLSFFLILSSKLDAGDTLYYSDFLKLLLKNHPVAAVADIRVLAGKAEYNKAQGAFEPVIGSEYDRKYFEGKNYFSLFNSEMKIPSWIGEVKVGYDYYYGTQLNNENLLPNNGMTYAGISLPLLQNLFTDKKRTQLRQAKLFMESAQFERILIMNQLIADATVAYQSWAAAYQKHLLNKSALVLAQQRHLMIVDAAKLGDRPFIDTVESLTQIQYRDVASRQATTEWFQATFELSNFCWNSNQSPVILDTSVIAELPRLEDSDAKLVLDEQLGTITAQPELNMYRLKVKSLDYERKLKMELLKPRLDAGYYLLGNGLDFSRNATQSLFTERYKFGVQFQMPLAFAQSRSEYKLAKYKLQEAKLNYEVKQQSVYNKIKSYWYELENYRNQLGTLSRIVSNNQKLLEAEQERFFNGESNVFLINARENKFIESQEKLYEIYVKFYKSEAQLYQQTGTLLNYVVEKLK